MKTRNLSLIALAASTILLVAFSGTEAAIIPPTINWEADNDTDGDNEWESDGNNTDPWVFGSPQSPTDVSGDTAGTDFASIQTAYQFPGATGTREDWDVNMPGPGSPDPTTQDATFELVFRLDDGTGNQPRIV